MNDEEINQLFQEFLGEVPINLEQGKNEISTNSRETYQYPVKIGRQGLALDQGDKPWIVGTFAPKQYINETHPTGHNGIDLKAPKGTPITAIASGQVIEVGQYPKGGNYIKTYHPIDKLTAYYAHLDQSLVTKNQEITNTTIIGKVGDSGNAKGRGAHLHLEIKQEGRHLDPLQVIGKTVGSFTTKTANRWKNLLEKYSNL